MQPFHYIYFGNLNFFISFVYLITGQNDFYEHNGCKNITKSLEIYGYTEGSQVSKTSNKCVWNNVFWYVKVYIFWTFIQYTIHWDKTRKLKKFPSDKENVTKNALFFLSRTPNHHSFTFNSRILYELKHKVHLFKSEWVIFHFWFRLVFIKVYIFVQQKA